MDTNRIVLTINGLKAYPLSQYTNSSYNADWMVNAIESNPNMLLSPMTGFCYSPLICIGKNTDFGTNESAHTDLLLVSPCGFLVAVSAETKPETTAIMNKATSIANALSSLTYDELDDITMDYTYEKRNQACTMIDLMAEAGYLYFHDEADFERIIEHNISISKFLYVVASKEPLTSIKELHCNQPFDIANLSFATYSNTDSPIAVVSMNMLK